LICMLDFMSVLIVQVAGVLSCTSIL
jgi:hypothetical protein